MTTAHGKKPKIDVKRQRHSFKASVPSPGQGTQKAKEVPFGSRVAMAANAAHAQPSIFAPDQQSWSPFTNKTDYVKFQRYDPQARVYIAESLKYAGKGVVISGNQGTAPELALMGAFLVTGNFHFGRNIFHQSVRLYGLRARGKAFTVDVAIEFGGVLFLFPVDGEYFHEKSEMQVLDSERRNWELNSVGGRVVPILDTQCYEGSAMLTFLHSKGVPGLS